ncbi:MAG: hypothetical protein SF187_11300 [Deltaproteobacteria bacterium]|nr:hypothetical protein [Deltaproteobacteria bacterium]
MIAVDRLVGVRIARRLWAEMIEALPVIGLPMVVAMTVLGARIARLLLDVTSVDLGLGMVAAMTVAGLHVGARIDPRTVAVMIVALPEIGPTAKWCMVRRLFAAVTRCRRAAVAPLHVFPLICPAGASCKGLAGPVTAASILILIW